MMPISGTACLMARTARQTRVSGVSASPAASAQGGGGRAGARAFDQEDRPNQIVGSERSLAHQPSRPAGAPVAPEPRRREAGPRRALRLVAGALRPLGAQRDRFALGE